MQHRSLDNYYRLIDSGQKPLMMMTQASGEHPWRAKLQSGIEVGRLDLSELIADPYPLMPLISQWYQSNLLKDNSFCLRLTDSGRFGPAISCRHCKILFLHSSQRKATHEYVIVYKYIVLYE